MTNITGTETPLAFFTLAADEIHPLALLCLSMTEEMMKGEDTKATALLPGEFLNGFQRLRDKLYDMTDADGDIVPADVPLDNYEAFAMMHAIVQPFYRMKGHLLLPQKDKKPISSDQEAEIETLFYDLKDQASDLLWRITQAWGFTDYGLRTLEEVFDQKLAVRQLQVDDKDEMVCITINEHNSMLFAFMFQWLDFMEYYQEEYTFAKRFYTCQFIHLEDYRALKGKLLPKKKRKKIPLTLRDNITLYSTLNLLGRFFLSDASDVYADMGKQIDAEKTIPTSTKDVRNFFLKFSDDFMGLMKTQFADNKLFLQYIDRIDKMEIE